MSLFSPDEQIWKLSHSIHIASDAENATKCLVLQFSRLSSLSVTFSWDTPIPLSITFLLVL